MIVECPADMLPKAPREVLPSADDLEQVFADRHGDPDTYGWAIKRRVRFRYYLPAEIFEGTVAKAVFPGCKWLDIGGGHDLFPENPRLAGRLVKRSALTVAVDPSDNVNRNRDVHQAVQSRIEDFETPERFDLATLRMVAEHVVDPGAVVAALARLLKPGGLVVVLTVNNRSPLTLVSRLTPFRWHHPLKRLAWGGEEEDTFPVAYRMNTRKALESFFRQGGFREVAFEYLDDLSMFGRLKALNYLELGVWSVLRRLGCRYPENCLLGVYARD